MADQVIGVNTAILTQSAGYEGIGFAMPSNTVIGVYNDLIGPEHKVIRGSIGVQFQASLNPAVQRVYGFKSGVLVNAVTPNGPADQAGMKAGDIITTVDGKPIKDGDALVTDIAARKPGSTVHLGYVRAGQTSTATLTIADRAKLYAAQPTRKTERMGRKVRRMPPKANLALRSRLFLALWPARGFMVSWSPR